MKDLKKLANQCMAELDAIGIQYGNVISWEVNTRAKNRWGQCRYIGGRRYSINITNRLLDDNLPDEAAKQTIIHELLHSVNGCMNHGPNWKRVADKVNRAYHYNIKRTTSYDEKGVEPPKPREPKYIVRCPSCGYQWKHYRKCFAVENPMLCTCSKCGVKLERIK